MQIICKLLLLILFSLQIFKVLVLVVAQVGSWYPILAYTYGYNTTENNYSKPSFIATYLFANAIRILFYLNSL